LPNFLEGIVVCEGYQDSPSETVRGSVALDRVNVIRGAAVADHLSVREADARAHQLGEPLRLVPSYLSAGIVRLRVEEKSAD
jgi:hypothetical protein